MVDRRAYAGAAVPTTLASGINNIVTAIAVTALTGYPTGAQKWAAVIDRDTPNEEKVLVTNTSGFNLTVTRAYDGTTAKAHDPGASFEHCITAIDMDEANYHVSALEGVHGVDLGSEVMGTNDTQTVKNKTMDYGVTGANVATNIPTSASPAIMAAIAAVQAEVDAEETARAAGDTNRYTKAEADARFLAIEEKTPIGSIIMYGGDTAPDATWLVCNGQAVSRTGYATLFARLGTAFGSGNGSTTFNVPDMRERAPKGVGGTVTKGQTGGADTATLATGNLPSHTHAIDHNHAAFDTASGGSHNHDMNFSPRSAAGTANLGRPSSAAEGDKVESQATTTQGPHTHNIDVPNYTGDSGSTGSGTAFSIQDKYIGVNYLIKAL